MSLIFILWRYVKFMELRLDNFATAESHNRSNQGCALLQDYM